MDSTQLLYAVPVAGVLALIFAFWKAAWVNKQDAGTDRMKEIAGYIRDGAMAFLAREYKVLAIFVVVVAGLLAFANYGDPKSHVLIALSFVVGAVCSGLAGYAGMRVATAANVRTAHAAQDGLSKALLVAFSGGAVMGMAVVGLGLVGLGGLAVAYTFFFTPEMASPELLADVTRMVPGISAESASAIAVTSRMLSVLAGFSLGASSIALFARVGGGIYTKAADVGADLVGKVEAGIPEDDPRNPATIADNVGDNVGDVAGMGADLFESYVGSIVGAMVLGVVWSQGYLAEGQTLKVAIAPVYLPLILAAIGIIVSIIGTFFVRTKEGGNPQTALNTGTFIAAALMVAATFGLTTWLLPGPVTMPGVDGATYTPFGVFIAVVGGLVAGGLIGLVTEYYTSERYKPVQTIAHDSQTGAATNIIAGLAVGMQSTTVPVILICVAIIVAYTQAGLYGIALAALGMLATTGIQLAVDAYGPIADNAGGIAEMAKMDPKVRERTDKLDAVGNTTAAIGKGFAIGSAALTALALFAAFRTQVGLTSIDLTSPYVIVGLFIGGTLPYLFSSMAMKAVGRAAFKMIEEVRRQFLEIPGLLDGTAKAEYAKCVDISTTAAIKEMIVPGLLAIITPVVAGLVDPTGSTLGGVLAGVTVSGVLLAIFMSNAGGAWDNAKKYVESGKYGGKNSDAHKAAVCGDTVGDPFKDTAGPSLNILVKLMSVVALVIAPVLVSLQDKGPATPEKPKDVAAEEVPSDDKRQSASLNIDVTEGGIVVSEKR